jgi:LysM repeat protein
MRMRHRGRVAAAVLLGALLLVACGGDEEPAEAQPVAPAATSTQPPPPPPAPAPEPTPEPQTYTVVSGDTLSGIAQRFGVTVDAIVAANGLTDPDRLALGDELVIPAAEGGGAAGGGAEGAGEDDAAGATEDGTD